ncbi:DNA lyase [Candidatus Micrarchaeota archaeon CG10_big_fil_rev_8_21_14_0_10_45_29]|nr:MAG: DNA lyase [Candidatus Micrarchaeota archaeon CG10_big_fil_rev_8_21_14_0_10_45_29]
MKKEFSNREILLKQYNKKKNEIVLRLCDFEKLRGADSKIIAGELCFCICAANSSAAAAWKAQQKLQAEGLLFSKNGKKIAKVLLEAGVRFHNNKAKFIIEAREKLVGKGELSAYLKKYANAREVRNALAADVKGLGMKEAGHFLRNIGYGEDVAILDRHIMKNLLKYGAIEEIPASLGKKRYMEIEEKMLEFSSVAKVPIAHLDLLFWSEGAGRIFK